MASVARLWCSLSPAWRNFVCCPSDMFLLHSGQMLPRQSFQSSAECCSALGHPFVEESSWRQRRDEACQPLAVEVFSRLRLVSQNIANVCLQPLVKEDRPIYRSTADPPASVSSFGSSTDTFVLTNPPNTFTEWRNRAHCPASRPSEKCAFLVCVVAVLSPSQCTQCVFTAQSLVV